ncbi:MAG: ComEA family DNA-binding protein [Acutalibacteraceae bacterium]
MQKERICEISLVVTALILCAVMVGFIAADNSRAISAEVSYNISESVSDNAAGYADSDKLSVDDMFVDATEKSSAAEPTAALTANTRAAVTARVQNTVATTKAAARQTTVKNTTAKRTPTTAFSGVININTATAEELTQLKGIGEVIAGRIVDYRNENGAFSSIEDIMNVSGIGEKKFEAIRDNISVN